MTGRALDEAREIAAADRRTLRVKVLAITVVALLAVSVVAFGVAHGRDDHSGSPAGTVRSFLISTAVDKNGVVGCGYLTVAARQRLQHTRSHPSCEIALSHRQLRLGGRTLHDEAAVKALAYRVEQDGSRARVTVSANGASISFGLRRATATERAEFQPPPTYWRIDSGIAGLVGW